MAGSTGAARATIRAISMAAMMTMLPLKRSDAALDRDVIFVSEASEEASTGPGIQYLADEHWSEMEAEICLAEGGGVGRTGGKVTYARVQTTEKQRRAARLVATGPSGHGSRPLRGNAVVHLSRAVEKIAIWDPPMRLNDTTQLFRKTGELEQPRRRGSLQGLGRFAEIGGSARVSGRERPWHIFDVVYLHLTQHDSGRPAGERDSFHRGGDARYMGLAGRKYRGLLRADEQSDQRPGGESGTGHAERAPRRAAITNRFGRVPRN